jgi:hypothetical protein
LFPAINIDWFINLVARFDQSCCLHNPGEGRRQLILCWASWFPVEDI